jgi:hypothetical protein
MKLTSTILVLSCVATLAGCGTAVERRREELALRYLDNTDVIAINYAAADSLVRQAQSQLVADRPILIATVVKIDALESSSTLGRVTSENIASRITNAGHKVIEMKFGNAVYMKQNEGEMVLTREITSIAKTHNAQAVAVGSYGIGTDSVYINIKLVRPGVENGVIAAYDYAIPRTKEIDEMLRNRQIN